MSVFLKNILYKIQNNEISIEDAVKEIDKMYYYNLEYAVLDTNRQFRKGFPEVVFCQGKQKDHILSILRKLIELSDNNILATRANSDIYKTVVQEIPDAEFNPIANTIIIRKRKPMGIGNILVISAGTADLPVAEEAAVTAEIMGNNVSKLYDMGVAGLHRLLAQSKKLLEANVIIAVAGMDGALPSVVAGLVSNPVIAVPTSIGYGANFSGLSALLTMLNSCSPGIGVVNIDNGFGAGYLASTINHLATS
ncbi:MAG: nickel pincer cofactor biosynthesis protein LarB [Peptococcaceae bacterium]|nr:nickel pincer cofactor biosynthesis protein LarB [Peptococcaceae bacterium]